MLSNFDRGLELRVPKSELVAAVNQLKADIASNLVETNSGLSDDDSSAEQRSHAAAQLVCNALREASLEAWVMKPLVAATGMREGTRNENNIVEALLAFLKNCGGAYRCRLGSPNFQWDETFACEVKHVRCTGLLENLRCPMLADSPDALLSAEDGEEDHHFYVVEVKTMTSIRTIDNAKELAGLYGSVFSLENVSVSAQSTELLRTLVPTVQYRIQVLHHAATLAINKVIYVVGTGGSITDGRILYVCMVSFSETFRHCYTFTMDCVRVAAF